jgi:hypothetical protein
MRLTPRGHSRTLTTKLALLAALVTAAGACGSVGTGGTSPAGGAGTTGAAGVAGVSGAAGTNGAAGAGAAGTGAPVGPVTYYKDVEPILKEHCQGCHSPGNIAPFSLLTYSDAKPTAGLMASMTEQRLMPPWMPKVGCGDIADARVLTDKEIATLGAWKDQGTPEGDPADAPAPTAPTGPDLGTPAATLDPGADYQPNDLLTDDYHCTLIDPGLTAAQDLIGFNIKPGSAATVHHVILFSVAADKVAAVQAKDAAEAGGGWTCFGGTGVDGTPTIGGWVPGSGVTAFPQPTGIHLDAGTQIVMQIHYNLLTTKHVMDRTKADLFYAKTPVPLLSRAAINAVANTTFLVPAGTKSQTVKADLPIDKGNFDLWGVLPHMHVHGVAINVNVVHPDGTSTCAVDIPGWNFHWQQFYYYRQPIKVHAGDKVHLECTYDNSPQKQPIINNVQQPPQALHWGEKTTDEMCLNYLYFTLSLN